MNLIFLLLASTRFLTKAQIRDAISNYAEATSDQSFDRMFERDKEELRELGIHVEVGSHDPLFGDEQGYRIPRDAAELDDIELSREEAAVVGLATQVWQHSGLAAGSSTALVKLKSVGVDVDTSVLRMPEPRLSTAEPAFDAVWDATTRRVPIAFDYTRPGGTTSRRRLQPWGIVSWRDRWYVAGHDLDREATRLFRVSRISGDVATDGEPGSYEIPEGTDLRVVARTLFPPDRDEPAVLRVRTGRGQSLRRSAEQIVADRDGFDQVTLRYGSTWDLAGEIASYGPDVVVRSPTDLRDAVIARLRQAASGRLAAVGEPGGSA